MFVLNPSPVAGEKASCLFDNYSITLWKHKITTGPSISMDSSYRYFLLGAGICTLHAPGNYYGA